MTDKCFKESKCKIELWITGYLKCDYNLQKYWNVKAGRSAFLIKFMLVKIDTTSNNPISYSKSGQCIRHLKVCLSHFALN